MRNPYVLLLSAAVACSSLDRPREGDPAASRSEAPTLAETPKAPNAAGEAATTPPAAAKDSAPRVTLSAIGDCTLGGASGSRTADGSFHRDMDALSGQYRDVLAGVVDVLGSDDLTIGNLQGPLVEAGTEADPRAYSGRPEFVDILRAGSVELVDVANSRAHDAGTSGHAETLRILGKAGIGHFGTDIVDRRTISGIEVHNLGFVAGAIGSEAAVRRAIAAAKRDDNLVVVSFHWGNETSTAVNDDQRRLGRAAIDAGADLVLGHHPKVIQGIEVYRGRRIVYSLGSFLSGGHFDAEDRDAIIYRTSFARRDGKIAFAGEEIIPVVSSRSAERNDFRPQLLAGAERQRVLARVAEYSATL